MFENVVYFDNAAATRLDERVLEAMKPYLFDLYAVATSQFGYSLGVDARDALDGARVQIARALGAGAEEFVFASGSTEASNLALKGVAEALGEKKGKHIITTTIEDFPVLYSARALQKQGFRVWLGVADMVGADGNRAAPFQFKCGKNLVGVERGFISYDPPQQLVLLKDLKNLVHARKCCSFYAQVVLVAVKEFQAQ